MEPRIRERFSQAVLDEAIGRYQIAPDRIRLLDGFESFMYEFDRDDGRYILRLGHSLRRSIPLIRGEVDWINYLARGGAGVARAVHSARGNLVELIEDGQGEYFLATAFVRAPGRHMTAADASPRLYERWGKLLGRMHRLSRDYVPADPSWKRMAWDDPNMLELDQLDATSRPDVADESRALLAHLRSLPCDAETYGLIHQDAHSGNFFLDDEGTITLFDFDDCCYSWYANDLAIVLFYAAEGKPDKTAFTHEFMPPFLAGYASENTLDAAWLTEFPYFLKLRDLQLFVVILRAYPGAEEFADPWIARYMKGREERRRIGAPFIEFDWDSLAPYLCR